MIIVIITEILHCMGSYVKLMSILNNALENQKEAAGGQSQVARSRRLKFLIPQGRQVVFSGPRYSRSTKANTVCLVARPGCLGLGGTQEALMLRN